MASTNLFGEQQTTKVNQNSKFQQFKLNYIKHEKCQSCTETFDHNGNPVGLIDNNCDTLTGVDYLTECPVGMKEE